ncbi:NAD-dependent epimerase/dehydratase family protein [Riemerella columbipharyngis]|uniref:NAD dependent epimerase/dehydratase family protein n=1 Tax=Riemerella columbipharyngis TaxID=1071918 RepID=A0A1G7CY87_9FLAO|nr:NAD-dependent epimerase/dehydratase family protein [Riemerella columbipharyngis]SDE43445.1 NAD dependent epimerase/dehydratase family protein [Riemerella columbipharyngis]
MIIGNGLVASLFKDYDREEVVFFASGVSNSLETDIHQFIREENLLRKTIAKNLNKTFIYFSTCSIYDSSKVDSPYVLHKLKIEQIVKDSCQSYLILRISNVVGKGGNPNLLMNYLVREVKSQRVINVHTKATRNLIDADDVRDATLFLLDKKLNNIVVNIAYPENYTIIEILEILESYYNTKVSLDLLRKGSGYSIDTEFLEDFFNAKGSINKRKYLTQILKKFY